MGFIHKFKASDEEVTSFSRLHWVIFLKPLFYSGVFAVFCKVYSLESFFYLISAVYPAWTLIRYISTEFSVTNKRLHFKEGFIRRNAHETSLGKLESIVVDQSILGRILGYGSIKVVGTGGTGEPIKYIPKPFKFRDAAIQAVEDHQKDKYKGVLS